jgi:hypothetical protein
MLVLSVPVDILMLVHQCLQNQCLPPTSFSCGLARLHNSDANVNLIKAKPEVVFNIVDDFLHVWHNI